jgi:hypothetical protein
MYRSYILFFSNFLFFIIIHFLYSLIDLQLFKGTVPITVTLKNGTGIDIVIQPESPQDYVTFNILIQSISEIDPTNSIPKISRNLQKSDAELPSR